MIDILDGFHKRMEFVAIVSAITNRKNKSDKIENMFSENAMENLILSVIIYIMETTMAGEEECTIENISIFMKEIVKFYTDEIIDSKELTRYIVKDILQNKGKKREYDVFDYSSREVVKMPIRLIKDKLNSEKEVVYELTKQGYNFLLRTKEVDDELGFKLEEMKLRLLISKKNYKKAIYTSRELIRRLKNKNIELRQFEDSLRSDINNISGQFYEDLVNNMYQLLEEEHEEMKQIELLIKESLDKIKAEERLTQALDEKTIQAKKEIIIIANNIDISLKMQMELLIQCKKAKKLYIETLKESIDYSIVKTYNFKEEIMDKFSKTTTDNILDIYVKLLRPLFMPRIEKILNLNIIYDAQTKITEEIVEEYDVETDALVETQAVKERIDRRNKAHIDAINMLFEYASNHTEGFDLKDYFEVLKYYELKNNLFEEKLIFMLMLKLYNLAVIDINEWRNSENIVSSESNGEFDLGYCLKMISVDNPNFYGVDRIEIYKKDELIEFEYDNDKKIDKVTITNFGFKIN